MRRLEPESDKFLHLDALRFLAATGVMVYHYRLGPAVQMLPLEGLRLCVDLFFIISGMVITAFYGSISTAEEAGRFLRRRFARLLPLHWATMLFYVCMGVAWLALGKTPPDASKYDWTCLPYNALLLHSLNICQAHTFNHVSWSISAEMFAYLLLPFSLVLLRFRPWLPALVGALLCAMNFYLSPFVGQSWTNWTYDFGVLRCLPAFLAGMSAYAYREQLALIPRAELWLVLLIALYLVGVVLVIDFELLVWVAYAIGVVALAADGQGASRLFRWLAPFGTLTYGVYMLHPLIRTVLLSIGAKQVLHLGPLGQSMAIVLAYIVTWTAAYVSYFAFETPMRRWLSGRRPRQMQPA